ncbi:hypothetical protein SMW88_002492 [Cronobacter sakazakii]|nr:hypothetical protein [Cronobacter sakazakii]
MRQFFGFAGKRRLKLRGFLLQRFNARGLLRAGSTLFALRVLQAAGEAIVLFRKRAVVFQQLRVLRLKIAGCAEAFLFLFRSFKLFFQASDLLLEVVDLRPGSGWRLLTMGGAGKSICFTSIC